MENSGETALFGNRPARVVGTNQAYDPATNRWDTRSPMPTTRNHAFAGAVNGKIYVIGGRLGAAHVTASSNTDVVEEYDPARDAWGAVKARMPTARSGGGWATYNGRIYVSGGELQNDRLHATFRALEAYEPATNRWIILPSMPGAASRQCRRVHRQPVPYRERKAGRGRAAGPRRESHRGARRARDPGGVRNAVAGSRAAAAGS